MKSLYPTLIFSLVFSLISFNSLAVERPKKLGNYLKLKGGDYLYAEDHFSLDLKLQDNFAIEFWFYLESVPELPFQQRVLFAKPGSYAIVVTVEARFSNVKGFLLPYKWASIQAIGMRENGYSGWGLVAAETEEWHHVAFETWLAGGSRHRITYVDGKLKSQGRGTPGRAFCDNTDSRFYIGDVPQEVLEGLAEVDFPYAPVVSAPIYLDEVRLSIAPVGQPDIKNQPEANLTTMALWHFDERESALTYRDSSRFQNTLRRGKPFRVSSFGTLTTLWGRMKR